MKERKNRNRRVLSLLLTLAMLLTMVPAVLAEEPASGSAAAEAAAAAGAFLDVQESDYYYRSVSWAAEYGVTAGTTATTFSPGETCTRAQAVTLFWRAAGKPEYTGENHFTDLSESSYYYQAANYCAGLGLLENWGLDGSEFGPGQPVTRLQIATLLCIYDAGVAAEEPACPFTDLPEDEFSAAAFRWCYQNGIIYGTEADKCSPDGYCTRAQLVTIVWRFYFDADEVTILYTNDVHTYINNKDSAGNQLLTYGSLADMKHSYERCSNVLLVDAGDHSQGTAYGAMDQAKSVIQLMNATGYDIATLGNHEFDYGQKRLFEIMDEAAFPYVSCNFYRTGDDSLVLPAYQILDAGDIKVAFVGITTPETYTAAPKAYFSDDDGNQIYGIYGAENPQKLYDSVQAAIDEIGDQADYVIALGHLGVEENGSGWTSIDVIEHTTGLDAFIDAHSHTTMENKQVTDAAGEQVTLTQTGCYLNAIGVMTIQDGEITTELNTDYAGKDETVQALSDSWTSKVDETLGDQIAVSDNFFTTKDPTTGTRIVRSQETNLGDLISDSIYWYFNEEENLDCDVAIVNGGGLRTDLADGAVTYLSNKAVQTFGNVECLVRVDGATLREMLEFGAQFSGSTNGDGTPVENGGFLHVAGIRYTIDTSIPCTLQLNTDGSWSGGAAGEYRVQDIEIYNRETGEYEPLDLEKSYTVAGNNYTLRSGGNGYQMFGNAELVVDYVGEDYLIASYYMEAFKEGEDSWPHICSANSPLASYSGYLLDYENPYGSGRITIR